MLSIQNLSLRHKKPIFSGVNLEISRGDFIHLKGCNGAGKTSLLRILAGLVPEIYPGEVSGKILYKGESLSGGICLTGPWAASRLFCRTVWEELTFSPAAKEDEALWLLRYFGIEELREAHPQKLSGGQQQLVLICAYLSCRPELILLDESFSPLSPEKADLLKELLIKLHKEGRTILMVEHHLPDGLEDTVRTYNLEPTEEMKEAVNPGETGRVAEVEQSPERRPPGQKILLSIRDLKVIIPKGKSISYKNLELNQGEILHLKGAIGSGKTTLIRGLLGMYPVEGEVLLGKTDLHSLTCKERSRRIGVVLQSPDSQFFCHTVEEEIAYMARRLKLVDQDYLSSLHRTLHLKHILGQHPFSLSHGEKKKCQLAVSLSLKPDILILDEPDAGLDNNSLSVLADFLQNFVEEGKSVILTSHKRQFSEKLKKRVGAFRTYNLRKEFHEV